MDSGALKRRPAPSQQREIEKRQQHTNRQEEMDWACYLVQSVSLESVKLQRAGEAGDLAELKQTHTHTHTQACTHTDCERDSISHLTLSVSKLFFLVIPLQ